MRIESVVPHGAPGARLVSLEDGREVVVDPCEDFLSWVGGANLWPWEVAELEELLVEEDRL